MKMYLDQIHNNKIVEAIAEFNLIDKNDNILVGLSGGKDSSFLLYALVILSKHTSLNFKIGAVTVDLGFENSHHIKYLKYLTDSLDVNLNIIETEISKYIKSEHKNPCAKCSHFKKGALVEFMKERNYQKIAFGHHYDDAVETFLMSIIYSGQINTLQPKRYLSHNEVYIIRPLIYLREKRIVEAKKRIEYQDTFKKCPYDKKTKREEIKGIIKKTRFNKQIFYNVAAAMRESSLKELWPKKTNQSSLSKIIKQIWG